MGIQNCGRKKIKEKQKLLKVGSWNVRTLIVNDKGIQRRTAIIAKSLRDYDIDIAALSETCLSDEAQLEEIGKGYTFYWKGKPQGEPRMWGVGFAIRTKIARKLESLPHGISDRLMVLRLNLDNTLRYAY